MNALEQSTEKDELNKFREMLNGYWTTVFERATYAKEPNQADVEMNKLYRTLGPNARTLCAIVVSEWLETGDKSLCFTAFSLIRQFRIISAIPALQAFIQTHGNPTNAPERSELNQAVRVLEYCMDANALTRGNQENVGD